MRIECLEPGQKKALAVVVTAGADDEVAFPHVDSCLAIAFELSDGSLVGGHVPMVWGEGAEFDPKANAQRIWAMMKRQLLGKVGVSIAKVIAVGEGIDDRYGLSSIVDPTNPPVYQRVETDVASGVDVYVSRADGLRVIKYGSQQVLYTSPLADLRTGLRTVQG